MLKNYLITSLTSCENLKLIKARVSNPDLALLFIPLCVRSTEQVCIFPPLGIINEVPTVPTHKMSKRTTVPAVAASDALFEHEAGLGQAWDSAFSRNLGHKYCAQSHPVIGSRVCSRRVVRSTAS